LESSCSSLARCVPVEPHICRRGSRLVFTMLIAGACAAGGGSTAAPQAIPDINTYSPLPNNAAPGASAGALAIATAIGRGVNFGNMLEAPTEGAWGLAVTSDFIDKASAAGFSSVRLPVRWSNHASAEAPFTIDAAFMQRVESVVDELLAKGLVVIVSDRADPLELRQRPPAAQAA